MATTVIDELITVLGFEMKPGTVDTARKIGSAMKSLTQYAKWTGAALLAAAGSVGYFANQANQSSAEMYRFSKLTGINSDNLQAIGSAAEMAGGTFDSLKGDLMWLTASMSSPIPGEFNSTLFMLGINVQKANGQLKTADEILYNVADKMQGMSAQRQIQWASRLGISNETLMMLQAGSGQMREWSALAKSIPTIVSPAALKNAQDFVVQMSMLRRTLLYMKQEFFAAAGPVLKGIVQDFTKFLKDNQKFIQAGMKNVVGGIVDGFQRFWKVLTDIGSAFMKANPGISTFLEKLTSMRTISAMVKDALVAIAVVAGVSVAPWFLWGAAILFVWLLFRDFVKFMKGEGGTVFDDLKKGLNRFIDDFKQKYPALAALIGKIGDLFVWLGKRFMEALPDTTISSWRVFATVLQTVAWAIDAIARSLDFILSVGGIGTLLTGKNYTEMVSGSWTRLDAPILPMQQMQGNSQGTNVTVNQNINTSNPVAAGQESAMAVSHVLNRYAPGVYGPVTN